MNHLLHAVQLYVFGRRASFDFHDELLPLGVFVGNDEVAASNDVRNGAPFSCGVVVDGNSDGLEVTCPPLTSLVNGFTSC